MVFEWKRQLVMGIKIHILAVFPSNKINVPLILAVFPACKISGLRHEKKLARPRNSFV
jgi:hypothetical protein